MPLFEPTWLKSGPTDPPNDGPPGSRRGHDSEHSGNRKALGLGRAPAWRGCSRGTRGGIRRESRWRSAWESSCLRGSFRAYPSRQWTGARWWAGTGSIYPIPLKPADACPSIVRRWRDEADRGQFPIYWVPRSRLCVTVSARTVARRRAVVGRHRGASVVTMPPARLGIRVR